MYIVNWNCNMAFRRKLERIEAFAPDIMIIQECEAPDVLRSYIGNEYQTFWIGENRNKGLCVFVKQHLDAELLPSNAGAVRYMIPLRIGRALSVIAFWGMNDTRNTMRRYIAQVWSGLQQCADYLSGHVIVAGDFNWNIKFDPLQQQCKDLYGTMADVIELLDKRSIRSAYHTLRSIDYGAESDPTFFMHRKQHKAYHTDYVFLSEQMMHKAKRFEIGGFRDWADLSDHMPIFVELQVSL